MRQNRPVKTKSAHSLNQPAPCRARRPAARSGMTGVMAGLLIMGGCVHFDPLSDPAPETIPEEEDRIPGNAVVTMPSALAQALSALEQGRFEQARETLARLVEADSESRVAANLLRQLDEPPASLLPGPYDEIEVAPGESLSAIAHRELGDPLLFVALARLNEIAVPNRVAVGTALRIPSDADMEESAEPPGDPIAGPAGRQPQAEPEPRPDQMQVDAQRLYREAVDLRLAGEGPPALEKARQSLALRPGHGPASRLVSELESELTEQMHGSALIAWRNRDVDQAIRQWESLLELVPDFEPARVYLERARELRRRLEDG